MLRRLRRNVVSVCVAGTGMDERRVQRGISTRA